ncbi:unnamed protein product [Heterobilharzia americana]|nr:unnamed protein product [Heterobilharzia americana]
MFLFGGYHYGFNSLIHIYKSRGLFSYNCTQSDHCMFHDYWYGISFHIWLVSEMCLLIFTGLFMDHIGLRALKFVSTLIYAIGTILFAITTGSTPILFILAGILVDLGCISNLMCNQQISLMFPYLRGLCIALLSGAFDSSTVISYIISIIHPYISLYWSLICLAIGSLSMGLFLALFIMTTKSVDMLKYAVISRDSQMIIQSRVS